MKTIDQLTSREQAPARVPCLSCGVPAVLANADGAYCKTCMQIHLLEKTFVQLTKLQGQKP